MTEEMDALVAAAAEYEREVGEVLSAVSLKAPGTDLGHEVSTVTAARAKFQAALAELSGNVPGEAVEVEPEPEPDPAPAVEVEPEPTAAEVHAPGLEAGGVDMGHVNTTAGDADQSAGDTAANQGAPAADAEPVPATADEVQPA